jgi:hypothetical protein
MQGRDHAPALGSQFAAERHPVEYLSLSEISGGINGI